MTKLNEDQLAYLDVAKEEKNVFLTGGAGTGKTEALRKSIDELTKSGKSVVVCAPTGIAALEAGGATIHSAFHLSWGSILAGDAIKVKTVEIMSYADVIVIDEISMCHFDYAEYIFRCVKNAEFLAGRKIQVIVSRDFLQLPPVLKGEDEKALLLGWPNVNVGSGYAFRAPSWADMGFITVNLRKIVRQTDNDFVRSLNMIRLGDEEAIPWINDHAAKSCQPGIYLYSTNKSVRDKNEREIKKLHRPMRCYYAVDQNYMDDLPTDRELWLCEGARVMTLVNDAQDRYRNGSLGTIVQTNDLSVFVHMDSGITVKIEPYKWESYKYVLEDDPETELKKLKKKLVGTYKQLPLKIAYAVTIHKSQGQTYDSVNLSPACFAPGQLYVALSRTRSIKSLHLLEPIKANSLKVDRDVLDFYNGNGMRSGTEFFSRQNSMM